MSGLPRLAVFDVDGTLISYDGRCSPPTRSALDELRAAGVVTAIATGRPKASITETLEVIGPVDYAVCGNGSTVTDIATDVLIRETVVPSELSAEIIAGVRSGLPGVGVAIEFGDTIVEEAGLHVRLPPREPVPTVADVLAAVGSPPPDVQRLIFFHDDYDGDLPGLASHVAPHLDDRVEIFHGMIMPIVEVIPRGDNKAAALDDLAAHLSIDPSESVAFGDGANDLEMLAWAGTGVAMGNARDEVQAHADVVVGSVDDDGVAMFVRALLAEQLGAGE